jgi:hypothetical protein
MRCLVLVRDIGGVEKKWGKEAERGTEMVMMVIHHRMVMVEGFIVHGRVVVVKDSVEMVRDMGGVKGKVGKEAERGTEMVMMVIHHRMVMVEGFIIHSRVVVVVKDSVEMVRDMGGVKGKVGKEVERGTEMVMMVIHHRMVMVEGFIIHSRVVVVVQDSVEMVRDAGGVKGKVGKEAERGTETVMMVIHHRMVMMVIHHRMVMVEGFIIHSRVEVVDEIIIYSTKVQTKAGVAVGILA